MPIADDFALSSKQTPNQNLENSKIRYAVINGDDIYHVSLTKKETLSLWEDDEPEEGDILVEIKSISVLKMSVEEIPIED